MDKHFDCYCSMLKDLENSSDPFRFLAEYFPIQNVLDERNQSSIQELKCACCLFGEVLLRTCPEEELKNMSRK